MSKSNLCGKHECQRGGSTPPYSTYSYLLPSPTITHDISFIFLPFHFINTDYRMFLLGVLLWNAVLSDGAKLQSATPTEAWLGQCEDIMKKENAFDNFSMAVSHGIHSITLQDIRFIKLLLTFLGCYQCKIKH